MKIFGGESDSKQFEENRRTLEMVMDKLDAIEKKINNLEKNQEFLEKDIEKIRSEIRDMNERVKRRISEVEANVKTLGLVIGDVKVNLKVVKEEIAKKADVEEIEYIKEKVNLKS